MAIFDGRKRGRRAIVKSEILNLFHGLFQGQHANER